MNLRIFENAADVASATARTILQHAKPNAVIALSGGRSPVPVYEMLGQNDELARIPVTWVVVDERYVPLDDPESNAGMMQRTLFARGLPPGHRFLRFRTELAGPAATAAAFEDEWRSLGIEQLDLILLGIGDDGHTASLFPGTPVLDVTDRVAAEVFVPRLDAWRVTLTMPVIRGAKLRLVSVTGASKAAVIRQVRQGVPHPVTLATTGVETWWLVDKAAVG